MAVQNQTNIKPMPSLTDMAAAPKKPDTTTDAWKSGLANVLNANVAPKPAATPKYDTTSDQFKSSLGNILNTAQADGKDLSSIGIPAATAPAAPTAAAPTAAAPTAAAPPRLDVASPHPYAGTDPAAASALANSVLSGEVVWDEIDANTQELLLVNLDQAIAANPELYKTITDPDVRAAFDSKYGDTQQGVRGSDANTVDADGRVQGQYQAEQGGAYQGLAEQVASMTDQEVAQAEAVLTEANNRGMDVNEMSGKQLQDLLAQDSPLMMLAKQDGIDFANTRGLANSSLAAGASMREMARQATPLALQQAAAYQDMNKQNQLLESNRLEQNANRGQDTEFFNAGAENTASQQEFATEADIRKTNAGLATDTSIQNASMANEMQNQDRQRDYGYNLAQLTGDQDFSKQKLASQSAVDIANIEGQFKSLISENDTAARMFDSTYRSIADILSNPDIHADEASEKVNYLTEMMTEMMGTLFAFEGLDLTIASSTGSGENSNFNSTNPDGTAPPPVDYSQYDLGNIKY